MKSPLLTLITINSNGNYNVGGVCTIAVNIISTGVQVQADAEVPITESKVVSFPYDVNVVGNLLFPGCHFVFSKAGTIVSPLSADDGTVNVCFGASPELQMGIYYYLDTPSSGRVWTSLPTTLEDEGRLICAPALYTGVYMPTGLLVPPPGSGQAGINPFFPNGWGGTVLTPPSFITITGSGTYAVGGICLLTTQYFVSGLSDTVQVEYPTQYTEDTKTVPSDVLKQNSATFVDIFYFPGCHVIHYKDQQVVDQQNYPPPTNNGDWQICFAAIPGKTMTIYYYPDDSVIPITQPWTPWTALVTKTANGMACADLVNFSAVYAPAGH